MNELNELFKKIIASDELKAELEQAAKENKVLEFMKAHGVETTPEEIQAYLKEQYAKTTELSEDELANVAGGEITREQNKKAFSIYYSVVFPGSCVFVDLVGFLTNDKIF